MTSAATAAVKRIIAVPPQMRSQADTKARQIPKPARPSTNIAGSHTYKFIEPSPSSDPGGRQAARGNTPSRTQVGLRGHSPRPRSKPRRIAGACALAPRLGSPARNATAKLRKQSISIVGGRHRHKDSNASRAPAAVARSEQWTHIRPLAHRSRSRAKREARSRPMRRARHSDRGAAPSFFSRLNGVQLVRGEGESQQEAIAIVSRLPRKRRARERRRRHAVPARAFPVPI